MEEMGISSVCVCVSVSVHVCVAHCLPSLRRCLLRVRSLRTQVREVRSGVTWEWVKVEPLVWWAWGQAPLGNFPKILSLPHFPEAISHRNQTFDLFHFIFKCHRAPPLGWARAMGGRVVIRCAVFKQHDICS